MPVSRLSRTAGNRGSLVGLGGPALFGLAVAASVVAFWRGLVSLTDAWSLPEYSHGPIIPLISAFLFLRELRAVPRVDDPYANPWPGVALMTIGLALGSLGDLARIPDIVTYALILWIAGMILIVFGARVGATFWPAVVHLVFMLPLPNFLYWKVSVFLQGVSSEIGVWLVALMGVPVFLDGNIIDLGIYKLQVAEACSGLRYLFPMLSFSYVFAVLYNGPNWHKAALLLAAAPITVAMNSFRIGMIGLLVDRYGIGHAEGFLHLFEGWVIFIGCVAILLGLAAALQRTTASPKSLSETLDIEFSGLGAQALRVIDVRSTVALGLGAAFTVAAALSAALALSSAATRQAAAPERQPFATFPTTVDAWRGMVIGLDKQVERTLGADDYLSIVFTRPDAPAEIDLFMAYYHDQMDGTGIHSPEVCIPAGGWEVSGWAARTIILDDGAAATVNRAIIQKGTDRRLVYFWFEQRGARHVNDFAAKFATIRDSVALGRSDGGLVRLITPIDPVAGPEAAERALDDFLRLFAPIIPRHIPGT